MSAVVSFPQAMPSKKLTLYNPSPYPRGGVVITPWSDVANALGSPANVRVFRDYGNGYRVPLEAQIDRIDPNDPSRDELVFALDSPLPAGNADYTHGCGDVVIEPSTSPVAPPAVVANRQFTGVNLNNGSLDAWINTSSNHNAPHNHWFGGALASLRIGNDDMLDPIGQHIGLLDPDRRAMQIDRIHLVRPPWDEEGSFDANVFDKHWRCVAANSGPLRATATIVSSPFEYRCRDVDQNLRTFTCTVHRAISVLAGRDVITEKVWVSADADGATPPVDLWFVARYFMLVNLYVEPITFRYPDHPGWFVLVAPGFPRHGYGFATNAYAGPIWNPPLEHGDDETRHRAFSWELGATRLATTAHLFRRNTSSKELSDAIGWTWYDLIYKPLRAW